ncbi:MAG: DUF1572 family protein [Candidatus Kapabacteria bacterium]|nr:DUF1572 family protein [Candidatus Kapabacteria bacterium]
MANTILFRDSLVAALDGLAREVSAFAREEDLWTVSGSVSNSAGTLTLHLIGNMNHFIGAALGNTGYVRDRTAEFGQRDVPRHVLLSNISEVRDQVFSTFENLNDASLATIYPLTTFGENRTTMYVLLTLCSHASYHLGQVNYLRRTLDGASNG